MKGGKAIIRIHRNLLDNAPWVTLEATGNSRVGPSAMTQYTWQVNAQGVSYWDVQVTNPVKGNALRDRHSPYIPVRVLSSLQHQLDKAKDGAEVFYRAAVEHLAPELVLKALDGQRTSWRQTLDTETSKLLETLRNNVVTAAYDSNENIRVVYDVKLRWQGIQMADLTFFSGGITASGSLMSFYMVLPQLVQETQLYLAMVEAAKKAYRETRQGGT